MSDEKRPLWSGRFTSSLDRSVLQFTSSLDLDHRIALHDVRGSLAHARMLGRQGILDPQETERIVAGLERILREVEEDRFPWPTDVEDVHTVVEHRLGDLVGEVAGKLHTARSRNDQVALDLRLFTIDALGDLDEAVVDLARALVERATDEVDTVMPGYTHLQRAQPVSLAHHLLAHVEALRRDRARIAEARDRTSTSPLGAGALAGAPYPLDPSSAARELGLDRVFRNSIDAVADRDFIADFVYVSAMAAMHASRLAEELVLWTSAEFGFAEIADRHATGSSIMPQKKNPDVAELVRGRSGRLFGDLVAVLTTIKGLPLAYGSDLQEQRVPLYDATELRWALRALATVIRGLRFDRDRMRHATERGMLGATDLADHLARRGVPFREAHEIVGRLVRDRLSQGKDLEGLTLDELRRYEQRFEASALDEIRPERSIAARNSPGGTAPERVRQALDEATRALR
ncbi:MAG TPA: argininosuccinate lyase [Candidatus Limnocylindria bacterium]|jgi:argininosuccinate lyase|nr:argininosuccinate lyase [Candidatus Limnocylindria bacterium]